MPKKKEMKKTDDSKTFAFIATFLSILGFLIVILTKRDDEYVMYYAKQSLVVFVTSVILGIISSIFVYIPILGNIIRAGINIVVLLIWLFSWIYSLSGQEKEVPVVGKYAEKFNF